jgi:hypothetical protein
MIKMLLALLRIGLAGAGICLAVKQIKKDAVIIQENVRKL